MSERWETIPIADDLTHYMQAVSDLRAQLTAARADAEALRRSLSDVMPVARAGLVGLARVGNEGVYRRVEDAQKLLDKLLPTTQS